jgi:N-acetylated-alpha-linked acidic dipeptidase
VLPISYADATPLLEALGGRVAPAAWRGGLPLTYHLGPGPAVVHLKIASDWRQRPIYDVIAKLRGVQEPDRWIVRGNHHDAWVFGAADPFSGHVAMMAEAKAIGRLVKEGWRPRRTLVYASWDGEEPGLLGSTEWVETHAAELKARAALYVNSDMNSRGTLDVDGSHSLQHFVSEIAGDVRDPETGATVQARAGAVRRIAAYEAGHAAESVERGVSRRVRLRGLSLGLRLLRSLPPLRRSDLRLRYGAGAGGRQGGSARGAGGSAARA